MKYMRRTAGYTWTDYKTNVQIAKELKITPILGKFLEYKRSWIQHVNRMPRNRLPRVMKHYCPTGRRNHDRPLKKLLDTWDRNGLTSGLTPWQIYDDDTPNICVCVYIYIYMCVYICLILKNVKLELTILNSPFYILRRFNFTTTASQFTTGFYNSIKFHTVLIVNFWDPSQWKPQRWIHLYCILPCCKLLNW